MSTKKRKIVFATVIVVVIFAAMFFSQSKSNLVIELRGPAAGVLGVFTSGDKLVVISRANEVYTWDWNDLKKWPIVAKLNTEILCQMGGDKIIYVPNGMSDIIAVSDLAGQKQIKKIPLPFGARCKMIVPSADGSYIAVLLTYDNKNELAFIGPELKLFEIFSGIDESVNVFQIGISNDGKLIAAAGEKNGGWAIVADTNTREIIFKKNIEEIERFDNIIFSHNNGIAYFEEKIRFVYAFEIMTSKLVGKYEMPAYKAGPNLSQNISCISISPDGKMLVGVTEPASLIWFWDTRTGSKITDFSAGEGPISDIVFSPDGSMLAVGCLVKSTISIRKVPKAESVLQ